MSNCQSKFPGGEEREGIKWVEDCDGCGRSAFFGFTLDQEKPV